MKIPAKMGDLPAYSAVLPAKFRKIPAKAGNLPAKRNRHPALKNLTAFFPILSAKNEGLTAKLVILPPKFYCSVSNYIGQSFINQGIRKKPASR